MKRLGLAVPALVMGLGFFAWPMASIITEGISDDPGAAAAVLSDPGIRSVAWFTLWQAAVSTMLTLLIGLPLAYVLTRFRFPGRTLIRTLITLPFVLPTVVVAIAFLALLGPDGAVGVDLAGTATAIIAAHVFFNLAVVVRTVAGLWSHIDPRMEEAAATLGASRMHVFRTVTLPLLRPAISAAAAIVFLFTFTSFGVVLLLGAPRLATIEVEIYRSAALLFDLPTAAALALVQMVGVTAALLVYSKRQERAAVTQSLLPAAAVAPAPVGRQRWLVAGIVSLGLAVVLAPIAVVVIRALAPGGAPGLGAFRALAAVDPEIVDPRASITNSVAFGIGATAIALAVALPAAMFIALRKSRSAAWIDSLIMLPIGSSAVTLGFGFVVALDAPIDLRAWWGLVPMAHALIAVPFVIRMTLPVIRSVGPRLRDAAATLGARPATVWRTIDLPILTPAAAAAASLAFVISLGEFGATLFVARPGSGTMTLAVFRLLRRAGEANLSAALALSVILIAVTALAVSALERIRAPGIGGF